MVTSLPRAAVRAGVCFAVVVLMTGCGSTQHHSGVAQANKGPEPNSNAIAAPPVFTDCGEVDSVAQAVLLINQGLAEGLVQVTISAKPGDVVDNTRNVPVDSSQVLSGALDNGPVQTIQEADEADTNSLPPARMPCFWDQPATTEPISFQTACGARSSWTTIPSQNSARCFSLLTQPPRQIRSLPRGIALPSESAGQVRRQTAHRNRSTPSSAL
jgi:hypothetical protein